ncbi:hypothetical protein [Paragemmobacter straminiformis]|uniref:Uncharacterized protein n=1 Tax=Paragemmobacter straminiformis TaxID=2045119 RepID=A0A842I6C6_9RHOB|nr:hypothetical protein [Gemmobacter straminiformis]MBC2834498.1 hypothetical protein [Gemmobacter straminiformis]
MEPRNLTAPRTATDKTTVLNEFREVILGIACLMVATKGEVELAEAYLGISLDEFSLGMMPRDFRDIIANVDLGKFHAARQISAAFDFAYQQGSALARTAFSNDDWNDIALLVESASRCSFGGEPTPLANEDSPLRRTLDMAIARMRLKHGFALTIRELALLADIGEGAVRTALSGEGIKTEGKPAKVSAETAEPWLRRRRGFIPTLELGDEGSASSRTEPVSLFDELPFELALQALMERQALDTEMLAEKAAVPLPWLQRIIGGSHAECDIASLRQLAEALSSDVPSFVGRAIETLLRREPR